MDILLEDEKNKISDEIIYINQEKFINENTKEETNNLLFSKNELVYHVESDIIKKNQYSTSVFDVSNFNDIYHKEKINRKSPFLKSWISIQRGFNIIFNNEKLKKLFKCILHEIFFFLILIFAINSYIISLEGCEEDFDSCLNNKIDKYFVKRIITNLFLSGFLFTFIFIIIIFNYFKWKFLRIFFLFSSVFYLTIIFDTGNNLAKHGGFNRIFLLIACLFYLIILSILLLLYKIYRKLGKIFLVLLAIFLLIFMKLLYNELSNSCIYWDKGLGNSMIDNDVGCKIEKPFICYEVVFDKLFDFTFYLKDDCKNRRNDNFNLLKSYLKKNNFLNINDNISKIGYPRVEYWDLTQKSNYFKYRDNILNNLIDFKDKEIPLYVKEKIEVTVELIKNNDKLETNAEVKIELKKDEELVKQRSRDFQTTINFENYLTKNILFIFLDSMSRNHFRRKFPKVVSWIEKYYRNDNKEDGSTISQKTENYNSNNNLKEDSLSHEAFQFLKYHGLGPWTNINLQPFFFGVPYDSNNGYYSLFFFKSRGYITGSTENMCSREFVNLYTGNMSELKWDNYDHDFTGFFCDPNFSIRENTYSLIDGPYSVRQKCLYSKQTYDYSIEYAKQFFEAYKENPKFFRLGNTNSHEGTGESVSYDENLLFDFLTFLESRNHLDDLMIVIFSDHGYTMPGFHQILQTEDHMKEVTLPFLYILLPKKIKNFEKIRENLKHNENLFITPYDIHNTLLGTINTDERFYNSLGVDIFKNKLSGKENCSKFNIKNDWCMCR